MAASRRLVLAIAAVLVLSSSLTSAAITTPLLRGLADEAADAATTAVGDVDYDAPEGDVSVDATAQDKIQTQEAADASQDEAYATSGKTPATADPKPKIGTTPSAEPLDEPVPKPAQEVFAAKAKPTSAPEASPVAAPSTPVERPVLGGGTQDIAPIEESAAADEGEAPAKKATTGAKKGNKKKKQPKESAVNTTSTNSSAVNTTSSITVNATAAPKLPATAKPTTNKTHTVVVASTRAPTPERVTPEPSQSPTQPQTTRKPSAAPTATRATRKPTFSPTLSDESLEAQYGDDDTKPHADLTGELPDDDEDPIDGDVDVDATQDLDYDADKAAAGRTPAETNVDDEGLGAGGDAALGVDGWDDDGNDDGAAQQDVPPGGSSASYLSGAYDADGTSQMWALVMLFVVTLGCGFGCRKLVALTAEDGQGAYAAVSGEGESERLFGLGPGRRARKGSRETSSGGVPITPDVVRLN